MIYAKVLCDAQFCMKLADGRQNDPDIALGQPSHLKRQRYSLLEPEIANLPSKGCSRFGEGKGGAGGVVGTEEGEGAVAYPGRVHSLFSPPLEDLVGGKKTQVTGNSKVVNFLDDSNLEAMCAVSGLHRRCGI